MTYVTAFAPNTGLVSADLGGNVRLQAETDANVLLTAVTPEAKQLSALADDGYSVTAVVVPATALKAETGAAGESAAQLGVVNSLGHALVREALEAWQTSADGSPPAGFATGATGLTGPATTTSGPLRWNVAASDVTISPEGLASRIGVDNIYTQGVSCNTALPARNFQLDFQVTSSLTTMFGLTHTAVATASFDAFTHLVYVAGGTNPAYVYENGAYLGPLDCSVGDTISLVINEAGVVGYAVNGVVTITGALTVTTPAYAAGTLVRTAATLASPVLTTRRYAPELTRISPIYQMNLNALRPTVSRVAWQAHVPVTTTLALSVRISLDHGSTFGEWLPLTNGGALPVPVAPLPGLAVQFRQELRGAGDALPTLYALQADVWAPIAPPSSWADGANVRLTTAVTGEPVLIAPDLSACLPKSPLGRTKRLIETHRADWETGTLSLGVDTTQVPGDLRMKLVTNTKPALWDTGGLARGSQVGLVADDFSLGDLTGPAPDAGLFAKGILRGQITAVNVAGTPTRAVLAGTGVSNPETDWAYVDWAGFGAAQVPYVEFTVPELQNANLILSSTPGTPPVWQDNYYHNWSTTQVNGVVTGWNFWDCTVFTGYTLSLKVDGTWTFTASGYWLWRSGGWVATPKTYTLTGTYQPGDRIAVTAFYNQSHTNSLGPVLLINEQLHAPVAPEPYMRADGVFALQLQLAAGGQLADFHAVDPVMPAVDEPAVIERISPAYPLGLTGTGSVSALLVFADYSYRSYRHDVADDRGLYVSLYDGAAWSEYLLLNVGTQHVVQVPGELPELLAGKDLSRCKIRFKQRLGVHAGWDGHGLGHVHALALADVGHKYLLCTPAGDRATMAGVLPAGTAGALAFRMPGLPVPSAHATPAATVTLSTDGQTWGLSLAADGVVSLKYGSTESFVLTPAPAYGELLKLGITDAGRVACWHGDALVYEFVNKPTLTQAVNLQVVLGAVGMLLQTENITWQTVAASPATRLSPVYDISADAYVGEGRLTYDVEPGFGGTFQLEARVFRNGTPSGWQPVTSGTLLNTLLPPGSRLDHVQIQLRETLNTTSNFTPALHEVALTTVLYGATPAPAETVERLTGSGGRSHKRRFLEFRSN